MAAATASGTPAEAAEAAPVAIPLNGLEWALETQAPEISTGIPIPRPGMPDRPQIGEDRLFPDPNLPQIPFGTVLPATRVAAPLSDALGSAGPDQLDLTAPESDLNTSTPGASIGAPLTRPRRDHPIPGTALPHAALHAPVLQTTPAAVAGLT
ncbi:hypothetical protein OG453_23700 [Streptomyces sp. NBC_01381]|uniref:hypothetical protein n=1 Tax=Streptomyces sp. NBC_01381 TaxID=2903845 RepID=UPI00224ECC5B|nr:hypothetical protein [Streptomyces sp. NBC_01381]MCX4669651.1 hypothetical protein [Streptomyces sp. NBC_01381]